MPEMNRLLRRQMRRLKLAVDEVPSLDAWQSLLQRVSKHYDHVDEDRTLMVHAENIAAEETVSYTHLTLPTTPYV